MLIVNIFKKCFIISFLCNTVIRYVKSSEDCGVYYNNIFSNKMMHARDILIGKGYTNRHMIIFLPMVQN